MRKSNKCKYTIGVNTRDKKKYLKPEDAINEANRVNSFPNNIKKMVPYKCTVCHFFHIGRTHDDIVRPTNVFQQPMPTPPVVTTEIKKVIVTHDDFDWTTNKRII